MNKNLFMLSEFTDPCYRIGTAIARLAATNNPCVILISKEIGKCKAIMEFCNTREISFITHATITGLGGTELEPNVPPKENILDDLYSLIDDDILDEQRTVIRIDPIIPFYSKMQDIEHILDRASDMGITQCRISVVDYYRHVIDRMHVADLKHSYKFQISDSDKQRIISDVLTRTMKRNIKLFLCAEYIPDSISLYVDGQWISSRGCASLYEWKQLGCELEEVERRQRRMCTCDAKKQDLLYGLEKGCFHKCLYCYWRW